MVSSASVMGVTSSSHRVGAILCLASAAAFGAMAVFGKLAFDAGVEVITVLFARFALAAIALWGVLAVRRAAPPRARRNTLLAALGLGGIGYATQAGLFFAALTRMDASLLALLLYTYPAMVTAAAIALGRETASRRRTGALLVSSIGLVLVLVGAGEGGIDGLAVAMGIGAALTYTAYILLSHTVTGELGPLSLSALVTTGAAVTFGIVGLASGRLDTGFDAIGWLWLGLIALISTVSAIVLFFAGLERVGPSTAAILSTFEPLVTVALAFVVFGEGMTPLQLAGGALVLTAVMVLHVRPPQAQPA
jgi:drug/metabolite transporter (DMT)-like permease